MEKIIKLIFALVIFLCTLLGIMKLRKFHKELEEIHEKLSKPGSKLDQLKRNNMENELKLLIHLIWYSVVNYLIALAEQIALWNFASRTFFWVALVLNVLTMFGTAFKINKLEKNFIR